VKLCACNYDAEWDDLLFEVKDRIMRVGLTIEVHMKHERFEGRPYPIVFGAHPLLARHLNSLKFSEDLRFDDDPELTLDDMAISFKEFSE
jgi:hypothetical protein